MEWSGRKKVDVGLEAGGEAELRVAFGGLLQSVWVEWHLLLLAQDHTNNIYAPEYGNMHDGHLSIVLFSEQSPISISFSAFFTDNTYASRTAWPPLKYSVPCRMI